MPTYWQEATRLPRRRRGDAARPVGRAWPRPHGGVRQRGCRAEPRLPGRQLSIGRRAACAGHSPGARGARSVRPAIRSVCPTRVPGSIMVRIPTAYPFLPVEGESLHQIPVGPVHAGIIEPGHFRFTADGETVVRLEQRLGYVHKGIDHLMHGATLEQAARLAGRTSGDSTVAYAFAFARAVESGARHRAAAARGLAARRDGGAGADRQPPRRFRRDLQRCVVQHHAGALRHAARTRAALCRRLLRPSPDDGLHRARRRRGRSAGRRRSASAR